MRRGAGRAGGSSGLQPCVPLPGARDAGARGGRRAPRPHRGRRSLRSSRCRRRLVARGPARGGGGGGGRLRRSWRLGKGRALRQDCGGARPATSPPRHQICGSGARLPPPPVDPRAANVKTSGRARGARCGLAGARARGGICRELRGVLAASWLEEVGESNPEQASSPARSIMSWACLRPTVLGQKSREEGIALRARGSEAESQKPRLLLPSVCKRGLGAWSLRGALRPLAARLLGAPSISHLAETAFLQPDSRLGAFLGGCKPWFLLGKIYREMYNLQKTNNFFFF